VPDGPFTLQILHPQPFISKRETLTAMIGFKVFEPGRSSIPQHCAVLRHPVRDSCEHLSKMHRGVRIMSDTQEKNLTIELVDPADRALETVRWERKWIRRNGRGSRAECGECERMRAPAGARHAPEGIGNHSKARSSARRLRVEHAAIVVAPRGHDQRTAPADHVAQRFDHACRPALNRTNCAIRCVNNQHASVSYSKRTKLIDDLYQADRRRHACFFS